MARARARYELTAEDKTGPAFERVNASLARTRTRMLRFGSALAAITAGAGLGRLANRSLQSASEIGKLSRALGISTEFLSESRGALALAGVDWSEFTAALRRSGRALDDASRGLTTQKRAFEQLNLDVEELAQLSPEEQFNRIVDALREMGPGFRQSAAAQSVFGRSGVAILRIANLQRGEFRALRKEQREFGRSLTKEQTDAAEKTIDAFDRIGAATQGLADQFATDFADDIVVGADAIRENLIPAVRSAVDGLKDIGSQLTGIAAAAGFLAQGEFSLAANAARLVRDEVFGGAVGRLENLLDPTGLTDSGNQQRIVNAAEVLKGRIDTVFRRPGDAGPLTIDQQRIIAATDQLKARLDAASIGFNSRLTSVLDRIQALRGDPGDARAIGPGGFGAEFDTSLQSLRSAADLMGGQRQSRQERLSEETVKALRQMLQVLQEQANTPRPTVLA